MIALYVKIDDDAVGTARLPGRPPKLSRSELLCLAVMQAMLGYHSEARWLRYVDRHLRHLFPSMPGQSGYNKRLRAALPQIKRMIRVLAMNTGFWHETVWLTDSTPVPCGMSRPTALRSEVAGWGGLRLLRVTLPVLLGVAPLSGVHPGRDAGAVGAGRPEDRRARGPGRDAGG